MQIQVTLTSESAGAANGGIKIGKKLTKEQIAEKLAALAKAEDKAVAQAIKDVRAKYKVMKANVRKGLPARGARPTK